MIKKSKKYDDNVKTSNPTTPFGLKDKVGYLLGDLGNDFFFFFVGTFLMVFYTDIFHISPAIVGVLFLVARLWDAFADFAWGRFIDSRTQTKYGKFRPWIFRMSFPLVFSGVLMFVKIPGMSDGFYLAWAFITYIVWGTLYSTVNIPYGALASAMSEDASERTSLSTWRTAGSMIASLAITVGGPLVIFIDNQMDANRVFMLALLFGILAISCYIGCFKLTEERIHISQTAEQNKSFKTTLIGLSKNRPLIAILTASLVFMIGLMLIGTVNTFLFKDYFQNTKALSMAGFLQTATAFIAIPFVSKLVRILGKKELAATGILLASTAYFTLYFLNNVTVIYFLAIAAIGMFGYSFFNLVIWAFVNDVSDYHEILTGLREDGTVYSVYSMARKIGQAIAGGVGGFAMSAVGYNSELTTQPTTVLDGIYTLATLVPALFYFAIFFILIFFYPLNRERTLQLKTTLDEKRTKS